MSNNIGRNDPCPCGSGKKYKKCCLANSQKSLSSLEVDVADFAWHKLRKLEGSVIDKHLIPYVDKISHKISEDIMMMAAYDFYPEDVPESLNNQQLFNQFFVQWFLFNWTPLEDFEIAGFNDEKTLAENYLKANSSYLSNDEIRFLEAMNKTFYSFYSVISVEHNKSLTVKDILLGKTHILKERSGTQHLKHGDIVCGRIVTLDDQSIFVGVAPYTIPLEYMNTLINFKNWLLEENEVKKLTPKRLREDDFLIIECFFDIMFMAYDKPGPILHNTDGELIQFSKSYFSLTLSPEETFKKLFKLALLEDPDEFLEDAARDESGALKMIEFPWLKSGNKKHKSWENTIMGNITLVPGRLILETNSIERTKKGKTLLLKRLGSDLSFQQTLIESPDQKLKSLKESGASPESTRDNSEELLESPEVQAQIKEMIKNHWDNWFTSPIPMLNDQTPREAAKTKEGRDLLEALLLFYERSYKENTNNLLKVDIPSLRKELGLKKAT
jgi:hypothetical protein